MSKIKVGNEEVDLDENILIVSQETINDFLSKYASWYRYYQNKHADASFIYKKLLDKFNAVLQTKFKQYKHEGGSDKLAEASAKSDAEVLDHQEKMRIAEYIKDELWGFLRSMDYAHDDALQLCYNMRKEMDKIGGSHVRQTSMDDRLASIFNKEKESE